jgi:hypothetical protein
MPDRRNGGKVDMVGIRKNGPLIEQSVEAGVIVGAESRQVVVPELIDHNRKDEFMLLGPACTRQNQDRRNQGKGNPASALHNTVTVFHRDYTDGGGFSAIIARVMRAYTDRMACNS